MISKELIKKVSSHFKLTELVCPHVYQRDGESAWRYFRPEALETLAVIRDILDAPMTINTWENGGEYSQRGARCNLCQLVSEKANAGILYVSAHLLFGAFDFSVRDMTAEEARKKIMSNADKLPHPIRLEEDVNWVHFDTVVPAGTTKKVTTFRG